MLLQATRLLRFTDEGRPFFDELIAVFATLMSSLPLETHEVGLFHAKYDFSFTSEEALANLKELKLQQQNKTVDSNGRQITSTTITTYQLSTHSCMAMIQLFLNACLIRCATEPDRMKFSQEMLLQLTAKGISIIDSFSQRNGIISPGVISLTKSALNIARLVYLERDSTTDEISTIPDFIEIIFKRFAGPRPNTNTFATNATQAAAMAAASSSHFRDACDSINGIRVHESKRVHLREIRNCFSGREAKKWILNCTTAMDNTEALKILNSFLDYGLLVSTSSSSLLNSEDRKRFVSEKTVIYILTDKGRRIAGWPTPQNSQNIPKATPSTGSTLVSGFDSTDNKLSRLEMILSDPALRLLFREHLAENFCEENLQFYFESEKIITQYRELMQQKHLSLQKVNVCISEAWVLYQSYLAPGSASEVNIDHLLRNRVRELMTKGSIIENTGRSDYQTISRSANRLKDIVDLLDEVRTQVFRLMATDSVPKFLKNRKFLELGKDI
ncbi:regulator of G protein signaling domain-containing protein [Dipodascopsis uninucleata]